MRRFFALWLIVAVLLATYGTATAAPPAQSTAPELRALWVDAFHDGFKTAAQTDQLIADAERAGVNALVIQVRRRADSYYRDSREPSAVDLAPGYDALADVIGKAHARGIAVHAWVTTLPVWKDGYNNPDRNHIWYSHGSAATGRANWLTWRDDGKQGDCAGANNCSYYLDPGHPDAADYLLNTLLHLVTQYNFDGLQLDYLRYPGPRFGYNPTSLARFLSESGRTTAPAADDAQWLTWRRDQVTKLMKRLYLNILARKPQMQVSLAAIAWGDAPTNGDWTTSAAYSRVLQDWHGWLDRGYLDWVLVMNYQGEANADQRQFYRRWVDWLRAAHGDGRAAVGIGAWQNTAAENIAQLRYVTDAPGLLGTALYSYAIPATTSRNDFLDQLGREVWNIRAAVPAVARPNAGLGFVLGKYQVDGTPRANVGVRLSAPGENDLFGTTDGSGVFGWVGVAPGQWTVSADGGATQTVAVQSGSVVHTALHVVTGPVFVAAPPDPAFVALWERTDRAVANGSVARSWLWGPQAYATAREAYAQAPGGERVVQYWDKSRMEVTNPAAARAALWFVTNGLLVRELVSGALQVGDGQTVQRTASALPIGGNADDATLGPSYNDFAGIASLNNDRRALNLSGATVTATINEVGSIGQNAALAGYTVSYADYNETLGHNIPNVFRDFQRSLPLDWVFVLGYPITEPYWTRYRVGNEVRDVLVQLYERRTLTYTPANSAAYKVEMGNVGQHYFRWRYNAAPWER